MKIEIKYFGKLVFHEEWIVFKEILLFHALDGFGVGFGFGYVKFHIICGIQLYSFVP